MSIPIPSTIEHIAPEQLKPWPDNPRKHSKKQIKQIAASLRETGFNGAIIIDENDTILSGHGRVEAARF